MSDLLQYMDEVGFWSAPCSGSHHLAVEGGLAEHTRNVFDLALDIAANVLIWDGEDRRESIAIAAILHDLGKVGDFGKPNYVPNILKSGKQSDVKPFVTNPELLYIPHEVRSVSIAQRFINLTEDEYFAILYHNGLYGDFKYDISGKETPLYLIIHFADMWASRVIEVESED